jgi:polyisoprenoid-binding protein YceI
MKKLIMMVVVIVTSMAGIRAQNIFSTDNGHVSFFSKAPVANVDAVNDKVNVELNTATHELTCAIVMKEFEFKNGKMGRDAEKKYIEIETYPHASFKGKIEGKIDYDKPGSYPATAVGKLTIHGVAKDVSEKGTVNVQKGQIKLESKFNVQLKDYNIEIPKILGQEMTENHVLVKITATMTERPKKDITRK